MLFNRKASGSKRLTRSSVVGRLNRATASARLMESLEPRQLLSADLSIAYVTQPPASFLPGAKNKVVVQVTNVGDATATGNVLVNLLASADATLDVNDTSVASANAKVNKLAVGKSQKITLTFNSPSNVADGNYFLLAHATGDAGIGDVNAANDVAASAATVSIRQPFVDLAVSYATQPPASLLPGAKNKVVLVVQNNGNVLASGKEVFNLLASADAVFDQGDTSFFSQSSSIKIAARKSAKVTLTFATPSNVADGNYFILADAASGIADSNTANNVAASASAVAIHQAFVDLSAQVLTQPAAITVGGAKPQNEKMTIRVTNVGNVAGSGPVGVSVFASDAGAVGGASQLLFTLPAKSQKIAAGKSITLTVNGKFAATVAAGTYDLVAVLSDAAFNGGANVSDANVVNNVGFSGGAVVITNATVPSPAKTPGTLTSDTASVNVGVAQNVTFSVPVTSPDASTSVVLDEVDSSGAVISQVAVLSDAGANGVFSAVIPLNFASATNRFFEAKVTGNNATTSSAAVMISGVVPVIPQAGTLTASATNLTVGTSQNVTFTVPVTSVVAGTTVVLNEVDSSGNLISQVATLNDAGTNGDLVAGDGIYSGTVPLTFASATNRFFVAQATGDGASTQSAAVTIAATAGVSDAIVGNIDSATPGAISGWAFDPAAPTTPLTIIFNIDGTDSLTVTANQARPDLALPNPDHGFTGTTPTTLSGTHTLEVIAIDPVTSARVVIGTTTFINHAPVGLVQAFSATSVSGWAFDSDEPTAPLEVLVSLDSNNNVIADGTANIDQPALTATLGSPNHGFNIPLTIPAGSHSLLIFAVDPDTGVSTLIGTEAVTS
jgi:CARDB